MTTSQRIILLSSVVIILVMGFFPPVSLLVSGGSSYTRHIGYKSIIEISSFEKLSQRMYNVNVDLLLTQWLGVILAASGFFAFVSFPKEGTNKQTVQKKMKTETNLGYYFKKILLSVAILFVGVIAFGAAKEFFSFGHYILSGLLVWVLFSIWFVEKKLSVAEDNKYHQKAAFYS